MVERHLAKVDVVSSNLIARSIFPSLPHGRLFLCPLTRYLQTMQIKITAIHGHGDHKKEYVYLTALADCDLGQYALVRSTYLDSSQISHSSRAFYWFPNTLVKKGDLISLWTQAGINTFGKTNKGLPVHRFYWGSEETIWNDKDDCAVLLKISEDAFFRAQPE